VNTRKPMQRRVSDPGRSFLVVSLLLLAWIAPVRAQEPVCNYRTCALRIEPGGFFSGSSIVRGAAGLEVADYGPSVVLRDLFQASDSAAVLYAEFEKSHRSATWLNRAGALLYLSAPFVSLLAEDDDSRGAVYIGLTLGGFGFALASIGVVQPGRCLARCGGTMLNSRHSVG
jgi:hypothetical protein